MERYSGFSFKKLAQNGPPFGDPIKPKGVGPRAEGWSGMAPHGYHQQFGNPDDVTMIPFEKKLSWSEKHDNADLWRWWLNEELPKIEKGLNKKTFRSFYHGQRICMPYRLWSVYASLEGLMDYSDPFDNKDICGWLDLSSHPGQGFGGIRVFLDNGWILRDYDISSFEPEPQPEQSQQPPQQEEPEQEQSDTSASETLTFYRVPKREPQQLFRNKKQYLSDARLSLTQTEDRPIPVTVSLGDVKTVRTYLTESTLEDSFKIINSSKDGPEMLFYLELATSNLLDEFGISTKDVSIDLRFSPASPFFPNIPSTFQYSDFANLSGAEIQKRFNRVLHIIDDNAAWPRTESFLKSWKHNPRGIRGAHLISTILAVIDSDLTDVMRETYSDAAIFKSSLHRKYALETPFEQKFNFFTVLSDVLLVDVINPENTIFDPLRLIFNTIAPSKRLNDAVVYTYPNNDQVEVLGEEITLKSLLPRK